MFHIGRQTNTDSLCSSTSRVGALSSGAQGVPFWLQWNTLIQHGAFYMDQESQTKNRLHLTSGKMQMGVWGKRKKEHIYLVWHILSKTETFHDSVLLFHVIFLMNNFLNFLDVLKGIHTYLCYQCNTEQVDVNMCVLAISLWLTVTHRTCQT